MDNAKKIIEIVIKHLKLNNYKLLKYNYNDKVAVYESAIAIHKVNNYWSLESLDNILEFVLDKDKECRINIPYALLEKIWLDCDVSLRKDFFTTLEKTITDLIVNTEKLANLTDSAFINQALMYRYSQHIFHSYSNSRFVEKIATIFSKPDLKLDEKTLKIICKKETYYLKDLKNQRLLKTFVEQYLPNSIEELKKYWQKIDSSNVTEEVFEQSSYALSFNKKRLYELSPEKNTDFFNTKLKALVAHLNKKAYKEMLSLERVIFDGIQEGQEAYHFVVLGFKGQYSMKLFLKTIVNNALQLKDDFDMKDIHNVVQHALLEQKLNEKSSNNSSKRPKI